MPFVTELADARIGEFEKNVAVRSRAMPLEERALKCKIVAVLAESALEEIVQYARLNFHHSAAALVECIPHGIVAAMHDVRNDVTHHLELVSEQGHVARPAR